VFLSISTAFSSIQQASGRLIAYSICCFCQSLIGFISVFTLLPFFYSASLPISFLISSVLSLVIFAFSCRWLFSDFLFIPSVSASLDFYRPFWRLGISFFCSSILSTFVSMVLLILLSKYYGPKAAGEYSSALFVASYSIGIVLSNVSAHLYPSYVSAIGDSMQLSKLIRRSLFLIPLLSFLILFCTILFCKTILIILFPTYMPLAPTLVRILSIASFLKSLAWPFSYLILAESRSTAFFLSEIFFNVVFVAASVFYSTSLGLTGIVSAYASAYCFYLLMVAYFCRRHFSFSQSAQLFGFSSLLTFGLILAPSLPPLVH